MAKVDLARFHATFFAESLEGLDVMEQGLLALEEGDREQVHDIFRAAHSIKGGAGTFGFPDIAAFTHVLEGLLDDLREGKRDINAELTELLLRSVDVVRNMIARAQAGESLTDADSDSLLHELEVYHGISVPAVSAKASIPALSDGWRIVFRPHPQMLSGGNDPLRLFRELQALGPLQVEVEAEHLPALASLDPETCVIGWRLQLDAQVRREEIEAVFEWVEGECELDITPLGSPGTESATLVDTPAGIESVIITAKQGLATKAKPEPDRPRSAAAIRSVKSRSNDSGSIRVSIEKVDQLLNTVSELVITQSMLNQLGEDLGESRLEVLREGLAQLEHNTRELQECVMSIRMLPISTVFQRFQRLVRDLGHQLDKQVRLDLHGSETELDKTVLERIGDPLVHLVRNALDHGIESPAQRRQAGKPEVGCLRLEAFHRGGMIVIEVSDDGSGLHHRAILNKAVERGLISPDEQLSDTEIADLIFRPGFSTASVATDVSGRGVGMDVVRRNVQALGGTVTVDSVVGQGTRFVITLPLTLAIIDGLTGVVGGEHYIFPLVSIIESLQLQAEQVNQVPGKGELFHFRGEYIPILRLHRLFACSDAVTTIGQGIVVVVESDGHHVGVLIDHLAGQQQAVIKSLDDHYRRVEGVSGATILGDGSVALILDVPGLIRLAQRKTAA